MNFLETNEKLKNLSKKIEVIKKEPNGNCRTEKYNNQGKNSLDGLSSRLEKTG